MIGILNAIRIDMDPDMLTLGSFVLTWHGFFTFVGVAMAVALVSYWAKKENIPPDTILSVSVWAILGGIVGARLVHVLDFWTRVYQHDPLSVFYVWEGGIAIYGAILGGFAAGAIYILVRNRDGMINFWNRFLFFLGRIEKMDMPSVGKLADLTAPALVLTMAIGRIGDIINGEHIARVTSMAWGFVYTHPKTQALYNNIAEGRSSLTPSHPAVVYEMIWDVAVLGFLWFVLRNKLRPDGMVFVSFLALYSLGRFFISFIRQDQIWIFGLDMAQIISLVVLAITVSILLSKAQVARSGQRRRVRPEEA
jgi:phosphatidylglycerol:prolipoprotein diacylglycerol transferase